MYYAHFGLKEAPFKITPNTEFFFTGANRGAILNALIYAINNGEGIIKVVGEVGSGKTMLCRMLQMKLPDKIEQVYLANPSLAPEDILFAIAFELQLKLPKNTERLQAMQLLQKYLLERHAQGKQVVIFVEEAQGMPLATLEEIRLLSNLETKHDKLLQIVLFGQPELDINLNASNIRQLRERITHSFNLEPIAQDTIAEYLIFRLRSAGYFGPPLFNKRAIKALAKSAQGLVRRVNILADKALLAAFSENQYLVDIKHINAAIKDSEFGAEQIKQNKRHELFFVIALLIVLVAGLGYIVSNKQPSTNFPSKAKAVEHSSESARAVVMSKAITLAEASKVAAPKVDADKAVTGNIQTSPEQHVTIANMQTSAQVPAVASSGPITQDIPALPTAVNHVKGDIVSDDVLQQRMAATQDWLKQQTGDTVTIQLMGSANEAQLTQHLHYLAANLNVESIYAYRTQVNNKPFITILYGSYPNHHEAAAGVEQLPKTIKTNQPQLRTIGGILREINQFQ